VRGAPIGRNVWTEMRILIDLNYSVLGTVIVPMFHSMLWRHGVIQAY